MLKRWLGLVAAGVVLAAFGCARAEVAVPPLKAHVTDLTDTLSARVEPKPARRTPAATRPSQRLSMAGYCFAGAPALPKSTVGGFEIAFSSSTLKLGLSW